MRSRGPKVDRSKSKKCFLLLPLLVVLVLHGLFAEADAVPLTAASCVLLR